MELWSRFISRLLRIDVRVVTFIYVAILRIATKAHSADFANAVGIGHFSDRTGRNFMSD